MEELGKGLEAFVGWMCGLWLQVPGLAGDAWSAAAVGQAVATALCSKARSPGAGRALVGPAH